jgi:hypothetical protein
MYSTSLGMCRQEICLLASSEQIVCKIFLMDEHWSETGVNLFHV